MQIKQDKQEQQNIKRENTNKRATTKEEEEAATPEIYVKASMKTPEANVDTQ